MGKLGESFSQWLILVLAVMVGFILVKMAVSAVPDSWGATATQVKSVVLSA
jgi:hypothetical protein